MAAGWAKAAAARAEAGWGLVGAGCAKDREQDRAVAFNWTVAVDMSAHKL